MKSSREVPLLSTLLTVRSLYHRRSSGSRHPRGSVTSMPYKTCYHPEVRKVLARLDDEQEEDGNEEDRDEG